MADKPILFTGPMVRALFAGTKTQTRRANHLRRLRRFGPVTEFGPSDTTGYDWHFRDSAMRWHDLRHAELLTYLPWQTGGRLWVRETWTAQMTHGWTIADARSRMFQEKIFFQADGHDAIDGWWPSIHMPREFSRLTLTVTDVRVERLQDISATDAQAEGTPCYVCDGPLDGSSEEDCHCFHRKALAEDYSLLWEAINGPGSWDANPWVAAYTFTVERGNIDQLARAALRPRP
jgi:hypothetical protein